MQKILSLFICSFLASSLIGQNFTQKEDSDPMAKEVLEAMRQKFETYSSLQADFTLEMEMPEQPTTSQKGTLVQQEEKYRLNLDDLTMVSDGQSVWLHHEKSKEVQINDVEEEGEEGTINSPQDLLRAYEWENYIYALVNEFAEKGRVIQQIEFKPQDRDSDYQKIRLTVDKKTLEVVRIKSFSKDGSRLTIKVDKFQPNVSVDAPIFTFTKSECPDCHFEDLRLD